MNRTNRVGHYVKKCFYEGTQISRFNIIIAAVLGAPAHFLFYFVFKYVFHLPYESFALRMIATCFSLSVLLGLDLSEGLVRYFRVYWHVVIIFTLPFIFTVYLLKNDFHELWLYWEIFMIFVLITYVPNWLMFLFDLLVGVICGIAFFVLTTPDIRLNPDFDISLYSIVIFFTVVAGYVFSYSNKRGQIALEKNSALQALSGSIAHEMRNPLGQVRYNLEAIEQSLPAYRPGSLSIPINDDTLDKLYKNVAKSKVAVKRGSQVITMILDQVREKPIDKSGFAYASAAIVTQKAIDEYGFESRQEREKVLFSRDENFVFRVDETIYVFVLFNLIMNALHYLKSCPDARIYISLEKGVQWNRVKVKDTGPGIPSENLPRLFDAYFTSGRKGGTGLGLAYCKRVMESFKGDITCDSVEGEYTEFILTFPVISGDDIRSNREELIASNKALFEEKRILVVDDEPADRTVVREILADLDAIVEEAGNGREGLEKLSAHRFDFVIMNLEMPVMNGYEAVENIRNGKAGSENILVPIVAYSAGSYYIVRGKTKKAGMQGLISKPCVETELLRQLAAIFHDCQKHFLQDFTGKSLLIVDDSAFSRVALKTVLEKQGMLVDEAFDGMDACKRLESKLYDLVLMDMRMPLLDGVAATKRIRKSRGTNISSVPIIGLSGDSDEGSIEDAMQAGMNDYLVKPVDTKVLLMKISQLVR
ncbi:MAG: response regulator [Chlorobium phaeobacteroides]|uniref:histidine kinase n=1 Tax=Chlorobium phaeobacteroides (strain BS1) TaxID=331678 RepID=B3EPJ4_CHLPB|nr:response regulator [Chlorobium phaeobacteroides]